jgi:hypothetical protein
MSEKRYAKTGEKMPRIDITGQAVEKGSPTVKLRGGYRAYLRNNMPVEELKRLIAELETEIEANEGAAKTAPIRKSAKETSDERETE